MTGWSEFASSLHCPVDKSPLRQDGGQLVSPEGRTYAVVDEIPVLLVRDVAQTLGVASASLSAASKTLAGGKLTLDDFLATLGASDAERAQAREQVHAGMAPADAFVSALIAATAGIAYRDRTGKLERIPVPEIPAEIDAQLGERVLDLGCNWGRWSVATSTRRARCAVGIDPSLGAVLAAKKIAQERSVEFHGVVGDARYLPFAPDTFDSVISYSVLQHFSEANVELVLAECRRVVRPGGVVAIQMASRNGIRSLFHLARRGFRGATAFDVRYWSPAKLEASFSRMGPTSLYVDCFFGLGLQATDEDLMSGAARYALATSEWLKRHFGVRGAPTHFADSVWVVSRAPAA